MALTPVPTIDPALPVPPNPADEEAVFDARAYAWSNALPGFGGDVKAIGDATYANAQWAQTKAVEAAEQVLLAAAQVDLAAAQVDLATEQADLATSNGAAQVALAAAQVLIAAGHASDAADSATAASESATEAAGLVEKYQGALAADPVLDKSGGPLTDGDWYVSTVTGFIRAYTVAGGWVSGLSAVSGVSSVNGETGDVTGVLKASGGALTGALNEAPALSIASSATTDIGAQNSNNITITGTTTITSFGSAAAGVIRRLVFSGTLTLTHNATSLILPGVANIATAAGDVAEFLSLGSSSWRCTAYQKASLSPVVTSVSNLVRSARSTGINIGVSDKGTLIDITAGTFTQTFSAMATLGNGWWCYIRNSGTGDITLDPNSSELIDDLSSYVMYPGEVRLVQCDGTTLRTVVVNAFYKKITASGNFIKPPGYSAFQGLLWGGGGSGGKGGSSSSGASGGGGGACLPFIIPYVDLAASLFITIAAGGVGPATTSSGQAGGQSLIPLLARDLSAYGGGAGYSVASNSATSGGGGGGADGAGANGSAGLANGGAPINTGFGGGFSNQGTAAAESGGYGGGGGGRGIPGEQSNAGKSIYGGGGGGGIGGTDGQGGYSRFGGSGGAAASTASGTDGQVPGGGGGATRTGAKAGDGGRGELRIWGVI